MAELHAARARVAFNYEWDWAAADASFKRSISLNAHYPHVRQFYSHFLTAMGRFDEALDQVRQGLESDPRDYRLISHYSWQYLYARDYDRAVEHARTALAIDPKDGFTQLYMGQALQRAGRAAEADEALRVAAKLLEGVTRAAEAELGVAYALSGRPLEARKVIDRLSALSQREYVSPYSFASVYLALADKDRAFEWLNRAADERSNALVYLQVDPLLDPLRNDPRFEALVRRVGLR